MTVKIRIMYNKFELLLSGKTRVKKQDRISKKKSKERNTSLYYLGFVGEIGFTISVPIVLFVLLGRYLDSSWGMYPKMSLVFLAIGCFISILNFIVIIRSIVKASKN